VTLSSAFVRRALTAALAAAASLLIVASAQADIYNVTGTGDEVDPLPCDTAQPVHSCPMLRSAVNAAAAGDTIVLQAGNYELTAGPLNLARSITISGQGPAQTTVSSGGEFRVFGINELSEVGLTQLTVANGVSQSEAGGNIAISQGSTLTLAFVRVTGGSAPFGAGIANSGTLGVLFSLIDDNDAGGGTGGALYLQGNSEAAEATIVNSTLAANSAQVGAAVYSVGDLPNTLDLVNSTVARNTGGTAIAFAGGTTNAGAYGALIGPNQGGNCANGTFTDVYTSIESGSDCGLTENGSLQNTDVGLASALQDVGGPTEVLTIPPTSRAVDFVGPTCFGGTTDQVGRPRSEPCDAGAYEAAVVQPPPTPTPTPTPVPPAPTPAPTATPTPTPVANKSVGAETVSGRVLVRLPGSKRFVALKDSVIPNGTEVDTRKGSVEIDRSDGGHATFRRGLFKISQSHGLTTLTLTEKLTCPKKSHRSSAHAAAKKVKKRKLFGSGKGKFRTRGQFGAATVRGTKWTTTDTCTSTTVKVTQGAVTFRDLVKRKNIVVRKGKSATARSRRR